MKSFLNLVNQYLNATDEEELDNFLLFHEYYSSNNAINERWVYERKSAFFKLLVKLRHQGKFRKRFRMSEGAFNRLVSLLEPYLQRDSRYSRAKDPVFVEMIVAIGLRWLSGGTYQEVEDCYNVSTTEAYRCREKFLDAILSCKELCIELPDSPEAWETIRRGFAEKSSFGVINGCVGAIDGFFQRTIRPSKKCVCGNVVAYFSGHYEHYGVNCLGICDVEGRYLYFCVASPGKTNDALSFVEAGGNKILQLLPKGAYFVGDAAYELSDQVIIPFTGPQRDNYINDAYNFFNLKVGLG